MKVLLVNNGYSPVRARGAANAVERLAGGFVADGLEVVVANANPGNPFGKRRYNGATVYDLPFYPNRENASAKAKSEAVDRRLAALEHIFAEERPDVVHTNSIGRFTTRAWEAVKSHDVPLVHSLRLYNLMCRTGNRFINGQGICREPCSECRDLLEINKRLSAAVDGVGAVSHYILDKHVEAGFFPNTAAAKVVYGSPGGMTVHRAPVAKGAPLRCAYMGWLEPMKGAEWLAANLSRLPRQGWTLRFAGTGERADQARLRSMTMSYAHIRFDGFVEASTLLAEIDLLIVPSLWEEPLSLTALEALSAGVPILTTGRGGLSEISKMMPEHAFLFDADRPETFRTILETFIEAPDTLRKMAADCAARARERFNDANTCTGYRRLYEDLLKR